MKIGSIAFPGEFRDINPPPGALYDSASVVSGKYMPGSTRAQARKTRARRFRGSIEERVDPAHLGYVADAQEEVRLMSQMVEELLAFAKAGMRTAELKLASVPLLPLVRRICAREAANCEVKIEIAESDAALAQPALLARALANVLRNAARYACAGGPITITARRQHDEIKLTIADRGPGVPPESLNRFFDPFYRLEPDRARATGGSGLGLAIAKTCIETCRGTVAARNLSPSGLEISITLQVDNPS